MKDKQAREEIEDLRRRVTRLEDQIYAFAKMLGVYWESEKTVKGHWEKYKITKPDESINSPKYDKVTEGYNPSDKNIINKGDK